MKPNLPILFSRRAVITAALSSAVGAITISPVEADNKTPPATLLTISEQMLHSTIQIISEISPGVTSSGTGFFFAFFRTNTQEFPVIVTNKHVIAGASTGHLRLTLKKADGSPDLNNIAEVTIPDFQSKWLFHPDSNVDLAIMPFGQIVHDLERDSKSPFFITFPPEVIPTPAQLENFTPLEDIILVGYPDAISDKAHNLPVFRRGITASPVYVDFDNMVIAQAAIGRG